MTWIQEWSNVVFLHFSVPAEEVQARLPRGIEVDTFGGQAWVGYVFFRLNVRPEWLPFMPGFSSLLELNVRTYVRCAGHAGIYFLRMYADNRWAIGASRLLTPLCYEPAVMLDEQRSDGSRHIECWPSSGKGHLCVDIVMSPQPAEIRAGTLDEWLLERYRLFVGRTNGGVVVGEVEHAPWRASTASALSIEDELSRACGFNRGQTVLLHHSPGVAARFHAFRPAQFASSSVPAAQAVAVAD